MGHLAEAVAMSENLIARSHRFNRFETVTGQNLCPCRKTIERRDFSRVADGMHDAPAGDEAEVAEQPAELFIPLLSLLLGFFHFRQAFGDALPHLLRREL